MKIKIKRPWLKSAKFDLIFILLPSVFSVLFVMIFSSEFSTTTNTPLWAWVVFVLVIDVSHVYGTLFRTYFNSNEFKENKLILTLIPMATWMVGIFLYSIDYLLFWRVLAYVAVFHFIRQQYGFLRLYSRNDGENKRTQTLDALVIYAATIYPILYWHSHEPRNFHWFIDGDFVLGLPPVVSKIAGFFYLFILCAYIWNELSNSLRGRAMNLPKNAVVFGTALSWYFGIVYFNGDMTFTITNVISHGIPYMALIWIYGERQKDRNDAPLILDRFSYKIFFSRFSLPLFFGTLFVFAYLEEGLWAGLVWREHLDFFTAFGQLPPVTAKDTLTWLVPLLTLPQATHYVLDGFIWKLKDTDANWQKVLFRRPKGSM